MRVNSYFTWTEIKSSVLTLDFCVYYVQQCLNKHFRHILIHNMYSSGSSTYNSLKICLDCFNVEFLEIQVLVKRLLIVNSSSKISIISFWIKINAFFKVGLNYFTHIHFKQNKPIVNFSLWKIPPCNIFWRYCYAKQ